MTSAAPSFRDSVPATLPHLLRSDCLHTPAALPPLDSPLANPTTRYSPAHNRLSSHYAESSMHSRRSQAPAHSASPADARSVPWRPSDVSCVITPRLGASDAAPAASIQLSARINAPPLAPRKPPTTRYSVVRHHLIRSKHYPCLAGVRKHPPTAQLPPMSRSIPLNSSDVSCAILPRLGPSDAAPAALIRLSARTTAPRLAPRRPHHPLQPRAQPPRAQNTQHHPCTAGVHKHPLTAQAQPIAYSGGSARSAASSLRDSVQATLPQLLRSDCLHASAAPPPLGSPVASRTTRYSPARNRLSPQHAISSAHCRRSQARAHSTSPADARSVPPRFSDVSCVITPRLGASDAAPAAPI